MDRQMCRERQAVRATADSWKTSPMPKRHTSVKLRVSVSAEEMARIEMGHIPQEMEDKWFMYCDPSQFSSRDKDSDTSLFLRMTVRE